MAAVTICSDFGAQKNKVSHCFHCFPIYHQMVNTKIRLGEGNGTTLQYCCLENPMDGGTYWAAVHGVTKSRTRLSDFTFTFYFHALEKEWQPTPVFLPGESQGRGSLVGCRLWVAQSQTRLRRLSSSSRSEYLIETDSMQSSLYISPH